MTHDIAHNGFPWGRPVRAAGWTLGALFLLVPFTAQRLGVEVVNWTRFDFLFAAGMVLAVGVPLEIAARFAHRRGYRIAVGMALVGAFLTVWFTGAVGIIGSEEHPANLIYILALAVGLLIAFVTLFRPRGMATAVFAVAAVQAAAPVLALTVFRPPVPIGELGPALVCALVFTGLFGGAGRLFLEAAKHPPA